MGIPVHEDCFASLLPVCPYTNKVFNFSALIDVTFTVHCKSMACPKCGPNRADQLLTQVRKRLELLQVAHVAQTPWTQSFANNLAQKRYVDRFETFTYRDALDLRTIIASGPIRGKVTSVAMPIPKVDRMLIEALWVPGHVEHSFSSGWEFPDGVAPGSGESVAINGLTAPDVEELRVRLLDDLVAEGRLPAGASEVAPEHWGRAKAIAIQRRDEILARRSGA
ncbi:MAG: hypothetical protein ACYDD4_03605 [Acidimicrobiales bacterium]